MTDPVYLASFKRHLTDCEVRGLTLDNRIVLAKAGNGFHEGDSVKELQERRKGYTTMLTKLDAELKQLEAPAKP